MPKGPQVDCRVPEQHIDNVDATLINSNWSEVNWRF